mmetsp:Transcript_15599/g.43189  ORF Transcript_15599/g.43189 Transcript_15599/m.43189 type:complete len:285 (+) Transcript_15599:168-1022(+)
MPTTSNKTFAGAIVVFPNLRSISQRYRYTAIWTVQNKSPLHWRLFGVGRRHHRLINVSVVADNLTIFIIPAIVSVTVIPFVGLACLASVGTFGIGFRAPGLCVLAVFGLCVLIISGLSVVFLRVVVFRTVGLGAAIAALASVVVGSARLAFVVVGSARFASVVVGSARFASIVVITSLASVVGAASLATVCTIADFIATLLVGEMFRVTRRVTRGVVLVSMVSVMIVVIADDLTLLVTIVAGLSSLASIVTTVTIMSVSIVSGFPSLASIVATRVADLVAAIVV